MNSANRSIAKNTVLLYIRLLFIIFIAFFTQRIVLKALGVEDYGIYNVVGGLIVIIASNPQLSSSASFLRLNVLSSLN